MSEFRILHKTDEIYEFSLSRLDDNKSDLIKLVLNER